MDTGIGAINENKLDATKNSAANLSYYEQIVRFFENDNSSTLLKLRSFGLYAPRQVLTDFLVRYELFKLILDVPGSVLELGVFNGQGLLTYGQASAILEPNNITRKIYGFDTFEGFAALAETDRKSSSGLVSEGGYAIDSYERLKHAVALYDANRFIGHVSKIELVRGDVTKSLPAFLDANPHVVPALVHLDMDVYEPTKVALELLVPRMPKGGIVVLDELNMPDFPGETAALRDVLRMNDVALKRFSFCSRIAYFVV
jgi:hypothetical protein